MKESQISFPFLLGLVFIILKLCKVIAWSWWWVTAPFWIPAALAILALLIVGVCYVIIESKK